MTLKNINIEDLKNKFYEITEGILNGETMIDVKQFDNQITFVVDCNRYGMHHGGEIKIQGDRVKIELPEIIEGGGIEGRLKSWIEENI